MSDYRAINHANWEARVPHHVKGYRLDALRNDPSALSDVVRFDRERLGPVEGLDVAHLQCHIGSDTVSLARLRPRSLTALDFSGSAIEAARQLAIDCGVDVDFVVADVYDAVEALGAERFDLVYTGVGAINWLPSIERWAQTVAGLLRPGGSVFIRDGHPVYQALGDPRPDGVVSIEYPYLETASGTTFVDDTTYVKHEGPVESPEMVEFNHGIAEIINAFWSAGLQLTLFDEHQTVPWAILGDQMTEVEPNEWQLIDRPERLPHSFTMRATKPSTDAPTAATEPR